MEMITGYHEIEHTADWELQVWSPNLISLLVTAARGMYSLSETKIAAGPRVVRDFEILFEDRETLLVDFLAELLFYGENAGIAFDDYKLSVCANTLTVQVKGAPIKYQAKEIKAVTYHGLQIREVERGLEVNIVFDV